MTKDELDIVIHDALNYSLKKSKYSLPSEVFFTVFTRMATYINNKLGLCKTSDTFKAVCCAPSHLKPCKYSHDIYCEYIKDCPHKSR